MSEATPRPWSASPSIQRDPKVWIYGGSDRVRIAIVEFGLDYGQDLQAGSKANAALIVRAVNAYDDMLAALKKITNNWNDLHPKDLQQARSAIAKAEGKS